MHTSAANILKTALGAGLRTPAWYPILGLVFRRY